MFVIPGESFGIGGCFLLFSSILGNYSDFAYYSRIFLEKL